MPLTFDAMGFFPSYEVEPEPEFPGDGDWRCPVFGFDADGAVSEDFDSRWGAPAVVAITLGEAQPWVGMFAPGGLGGVDGLFACPGNAELLVVVQGLAYLLNVDSQPSGAQIVHQWVRDVVRVSDLDLLLLVGNTNISALGPSGESWKTPRIALDGLQVLQATAHTIVCNCESFHGDVIVELDPRSGQPTTEIPQFP